MEDHLVTLDLDVQDCFSPSSPENPCPIPAEQWETWFQCWLEQLKSDLPVAPNYEMSLRLTDDPEIQTLNAQFRAKDQPTDVLAFAALETEMPQLPGTPLYLGDIVISVETASRQAQEQNHSLTQELAWLASHGTLHLLGWDHPDDESLNRMLKQQQVLLQAIGLVD